MPPTTLSPTSTPKPSTASDSDDEGVAFSRVDFAGVDFGGEAGGDGPKSESARDERRDAPDEAEGEAPPTAAKEVEVRTAGDDADPTASGVESPDADRSDARGRRVDGPSERRGAPPDVRIAPDAEFEPSPSDRRLRALELDSLLPRSGGDSGDAAGDGGGDGARDALELLRRLKRGEYADALRSPVARELFGGESETSGWERGAGAAESLGPTGAPFMMENIKLRALRYCSTDRDANKSLHAKCLELELMGIASLNLFLQLNYTGPSMDRGLKPEEGQHAHHPLEGIHPHGMFETLAKTEDGKKSTVAIGDVNVSVPSSLPPISEEKPAIIRPSEIQSLHSLKERGTTDAFHNAVLSELAWDGEWPFQACRAPYFLMLARSLLSLLAEPSRPFRRWLRRVDDGSGEAVGGPSAEEISDACGGFAAAANYLVAAPLWNARAAVAHRRLIAVRRDDDDGAACPALWNEAEEMFRRSLRLFCDGRRLFAEEARNALVAASVALEWGLAQHHFRKAGRGKASFREAMAFAKLEVEVTGAEGKRTKYQKKSTAQYLVRAKHDGVSHSGPDKAASEENTAAVEDGAQPEKDKNAHIEAQMIKHDDVSDDALLLEKINFNEDEDNRHYNLSILDQSILLALCLDVKNDNPMDGLTGEQMGGFLARVLNQHDDWMVYATALLERAWLECERTHGRERAILQIQALADQHSNRLTLTQSTFKSVEEDSAPAQDRLRNIHGIVYPPRWDMLRDLAERYAKLGVVTSAAEIFEELELWDEVVECYRIAGKESKAEEVVRKRLAEKETPRMYAALGDLTKDPRCFERSLELSRGKFYDAHVALGKYYFNKGDLRAALKHYLDALATKPLMPAVWFRVGTIGMQLKEWDIALKAFTEVVQQQPDEGDAWANVAAVHMYRRNPAEAYPALLESLKQNRNNWRVWVSKLYTCIDLKKYDEAIQACNELIGLKARRNESEKVPMIEEKCIRAITGGSIQNYLEARNSGNEYSTDSAKRTLIRLRDLLDKMQETTKSEAWVYEVSAHLNAEMGWKEDVLGDLMKEYRTMQSEKWEQDPAKVTKFIGLIKDISECHKKEGTVESLSKCKMLINGVKKKIHDGCYNTEPSKEVGDLDSMVSELNHLIAAAKTK